MKYVWGRRLISLVTVVIFSSALPILLSTPRSSPPRAPTATPAVPVRDLVPGPGASEFPAESLNPKPPALPPQTRQMMEQFSDAFETVAARIDPFVVAVRSETVASVQCPFAGIFGHEGLRGYFGAGSEEGQQEAPKQTVRGLGSGVIVSKDGYILTNSHVVAGANRLTVELRDRHVYDARIVGIDPASDVAVIKIDQTDLPAATLGNSDSTRVGEWVVAVGNPFQLMHTVTTGIISAKGRSNVGLAELEDFIQTDASINPGNSGGALTDLDGRVIGINTAIASVSGGSMGVGFAIPINLARSVMHELIHHGQVARGYLGVSLQDITDDLARSLKLPSLDGALVGDVSPHGPADRAGIERGDGILSLNGTPVTSSSDLRNQIAQMRPGTSLDLGISRDGMTREVVVVLGTRPAQETAAVEPSQPPDAHSDPMLGLALHDLIPDLARELGMSSRERGVLVMSISAGSPADEAGIVPGDVIQEINHSEIRSVTAFRHVIETLPNGSAAAVLIRRGENTMYAGIALP